MSNPTPQAPKVNEATVVNDPTTAPAAPTPKVPGKVATAFRHPIQTIKRHSVVSTALVTAAAAVAGTLLLTKDKDSDGGGDSGGSSSDSSEDSSTDNVIAL